MIRRLRWWWLVGLAGVAAVGGLYLFWPLPRSAADPSARADAAVVLGGGGPERTDAAWRLWQEGRVGRVLVTGDSDRIWPALRWRGLPESALWHGNEATSTWGNAGEVEGELRRTGARSVLLVTTDYHADRALRVFRQRIPDLAWAAWSVPPSGPEPYPWLWWHLRERLARTWYALRYRVSF